MKEYFPCNKINPLIYHRSLKRTEGSCVAKQVGIVIHSYRRIQPLWFYVRSIWKVNRLSSFHINPITVSDFIEVSGATLKIR